MHPGEQDATFGRAKLGWVLGEEHPPRAPAAPPRGTDPVPAQEALASRAAQPQAEPAHTHVWL